MAELLNVGTSSLLAYQKALATTGHNIANVNTEGYSRQSLTLDTRAPSLGAGGYVGSGVEVSTVARAYNSFLSEDLRANHSSFHHLDTFTEYGAAFSSWGTPDLWRHESHLDSVVGTLRGGLVCI